MNRWLTFVTIALFAAPAAVALTWLLTPFWGWVETRFAIEARGHSGPAEWCYVAVYIFLVMGAGVIWQMTRRKSRPPA
jgi:hypothetical protein